MQRKAETDGDLKCASIASLILNVLSLNLFGILQAIFALIGRAGDEKSWGSWKCPMKAMFILSLIFHIIYIVAWAILSILFLLFAAIALFITMLILVLIGSFAICYCCKTSHRYEELYSSQIVAETSGQVSGFNQYGPGAASYPPPQALQPAGAYPPPAQSQPNGNQGVINNKQEKKKHSLIKILARTIHRRKGWLFIDILPSRIFTTF